MTTQLIVFDTMKLRHLPNDIDAFQKLIILLGRAEPRKGPSCEDGPFDIL